MRKKILQQFKTLTVALLIITLFTPFATDSAKDLKTTFPKRANYFLSWELSDATAQDLAQWDLVILDMEHQIKNPTKIKKMRELNPNIIILAYIASQELRDDAVALRAYTPLRAQIAESAKEAWWLKNSSGGKISWWPGTHLLNVTDLAPKVDGQNWSDFLAKFLSDKILSSGLWDGVFFDNTWDSITEKVGANLDLNNDGVAESREAIESSYKRGLDNVFNNLRNLTQNKYILMGNDGDIFTSLNGMMFENFPYARGWSKMLQDYNIYPTKATAPSFSLFNANTNNAGGKDSYQTMRYGLTSALLGNGYYSFDLGDKDHGQTWWYDEYNIKLGESTGAATYVRTGQTNNYNLKGLWRRDYQNGVVLVNSGNNNETVELGAEFEKIKGSQDAPTNDGTIISSVTIPPQDGIILLRPVDQIAKAVFNNGAFARIYNSNGVILRNGFFSYDNRFRGGEKIFVSDAISIGTEKNKIKIIKDGATSEFYPFGKGLKGELSLAYNPATELLAVSRLNENSEVKVFDLNGTMKKAFYAFATSIGGVNLALGDVNADGALEIIAGQTKNRSQVRIFSLAGKQLGASFYAFGSAFRGGVNLAAGDINGDGKDEIVAGAGTGKPEIRMFNEKGKQVTRSFLGAASSVKAGIKVATADVDDDGVAEIISLSSNIFTTTMK
ncbi:MAG: putative glycoside hydrolase [Candidatus Magasanikbacteria bacterium]|nr:putative glycoside hydrolase [Candidatus Magasanikbacteria bacterium]